MHEFKKGDCVFCHINGTGIVKRISNHFSESYPIVKFDKFDFTCGYDPKYLQKITSYKRLEIILKG